MSAIFPWAFWKEGGFSPYSISNMLLWLDSTDSTKILYHSNGQVSGWVDKSPNNHIYNQQSSDFLMNDLSPGIWFSGYNSFLENTSDYGNPFTCNDHRTPVSNVTLYTVLKTDTDYDTFNPNHGSWGDFYGAGDSDLGTDRASLDTEPPYSHYPWEGAGNDIYENFGKAGLSEGTTPLGREKVLQSDFGTGILMKHIMSIRRNVSTPSWTFSMITGSDFPAFVHTSSNPVSVATGFYTGDTTIGLSVRGNPNNNDFGYYKGTIYEILAYSGELSTTNRTKIENYLKTKYNI